MRLIGRERAEAVACLHAGTGRLRLLLLPLEQLLPLGDVAVLISSRSVIERTDLAPGPIEPRAGSVDVRCGCLDVGAIDAEVVELVRLVA